MALLNIEIDGKPAQVESGRTVMDAAKKLGIKFANKTTDAELSAAVTAALDKE